MFLSLGNFALALCQQDEFRQVVGIQFQAGGQVRQSGIAVDRASGGPASGAVSGAAGTGVSQEHDDGGEPGAGLSTFHQRAAAKLSFIMKVSSFSAASRIERTMAAARLDQYQSQ